MTPQEKLDQRIAAWRSIENRSFDSEETAATYQRRTQRFLDVVNLKQPDRVPNLFMASGYMMIYGGATLADTFYNSDKAGRALMKFLEDFQPEYQVLGMSAAFGRILDLLGYRVYRWPGGNLPDNVPFQYVEGEYMAADEYDRLIRNPEGFLLRTYLPRAFDKLHGLELLPNLYNAVEISGIGMLLGPLSQPPLRAAIDRILQAADMMKESAGMTMGIGAQVIKRWGIPGILGGVTFAPFDIISDTLRGTQGALMDMYRRPDQLLAACEVLTPISVDMADSMKVPGMPPFVFIPLHKGADGFMSNDQFMHFYWPSLKAQLLGMIDAGLIPILFVEGSYNKRLDIIAASGLPPGKTIWWFDQTDMKEAKKKIGDWACIGGNVPSSLFITGTAHQMEDYCRALIENAGAGGGFFLAPGVAPESAKAENVHAFIDSTKKFGVY
jgi:uroporphyrinogen-III decarboxylase